MATWGLLAATFAASLVAFVVSLVVDVRKN